jgi:hypothetical protein
MDCRRCSKDHNHDASVGDVHTELNGDEIVTQIFNGTSWLTPMPGAYTSASIVTTTMPSTTTTSSPSVLTVPHTSGMYTGTHMHIPEGVLLKKAPSPEFKTFPLRKDFVAVELNKHTYGGNHTCQCGKAVTNSYEHALHIAEVAIDAADAWDIELMKDNGEIDEED